MSADPDLNDPRAQAALALHRFGMGPKPGGIGAVASDPRGAVLAELKADAGRIDDSGLMNGGAAARAAFDFRQERKERRQARQEHERRENEKRGPDAAGGVATMDGSKADNADRPGMDAAKREMQETGSGPKPNGGPGVPQRIYLDEARARVEAALRPDVGFVERLVWFWSNHFCVSASKAAVRPLCGAYEREAIRAHVLGKFSDMLLAAETHPAMLIYLDNTRSIGPGSTAGIRRGKGINENLAREILELHTLGVRTGYTQEDVTSFAKVISGWTIVPLRQERKHSGEFAFNPRMHEPGAQNVLGKSYPGRDFEQGRAVLLDLARNPATARHIATKLARHFVADEPPQPLVDRLARRFLDTGGDLLEVSKTLASAPEAWAAPRAN